MYNLSGISLDYVYSWADLRNTNEDYNVNTVRDFGLTVALIVAAMPSIVEFVTKANIISYSFSI